MWEGRTPVGVPLARSRTHTEGWCAAWTLRTSACFGPCLQRSRPLGGASAVRFLPTRPRPELERHGPNTLQLPTPLSPTTRGCLRLDELRFDAHPLPTTVPGYTGVSFSSMGAVGGGGGAWYGVPDGKFAFVSGMWGLGVGVLRHRVRRVSWRVPHRQTGDGRTTSSSTTHRCQTQNPSHQFGGGAPRVGLQVYLEGPKAWGTLFLRGLRHTVWAIIPDYGRNSVYGRFPHTVYSPNVIFSPILCYIFFLVPFLHK